ncbi:SRPBCC family protein [Rhodopirellula sp. JC740]|uniref:SRPBCC family protein n=1 Tax=Rhodopirellula halodulae TaxID=2894198 RepID=A0ABS8NKD4_9BACT|nr:MULTISPECIES: SRPBCC family protein [unclassified Rhodopirellula]MCC9644015.1 SRPBCC family protein [Rhodopirellula sp. JC740]MCC9657178.1 SRPBCC family protein [Rhodopirellula sp. JC737]
MPAFHIQRSQCIDADVQDVYDAVVDYSTWTRWSPWLQVDPEAEVNVSEPSNKIGATYHWNGELVGEGSMTHSQLEPPKNAASKASMKADLAFIKPFKSESKVEFEIEPMMTDGRPGSKITWHMRGKLPWFLFWMKSMMEVFVGMDYERGLLMFKQFVETGEVLSKLEIQGVVNEPERMVIGQRGGCTMDDLGEHMTATLNRVKPHYDSSDARVHDWASLYHTTSDLRKRWFDYTAGYLADAGTPVPNDCVADIAPAGKFLLVRHIGDYAHMGNAWSGGIQYIRYKKLKMAKAVGYEIYRNDPETTETKDLITDVYIALK